MEENTSNKISDFFSSLFGKIVNLVMVLVIISLVVLVGWFWHRNEMLKDDVKNLEMKINESNDKIEKMEVKNNLKVENFELKIEKENSEKFIFEDKDNLKVYKLKTDDESFVTISFPSNSIINEESKEFNSDLGKIKYEVNEKECWVVIEPRVGGIGDDSEIKTESKFMNINGIEWKELKWTSLNNETIYHSFLFIHDDKFFSIAINPENYNYCSDSYNDVLASFKIFEE